MRFDLLTSDVPKSEAEHFAAMNKAPYKETTALVVVIITVAVTIIVSGVLLNSLDLKLKLIMTGFAIALTVAAIIATIAHQKRNSIERAQRGLRVSRFALSNDWTYRAYVQNPPYKATLFSIGDQYTFEDVVTSDAFEAGSVSFFTGSGRSRQQHRYGYMVMPLARRLPHMILDSKSNNIKFFGASISNLPVTFKKNQINLLEGDFNEHYTLYAPEDYGADVRYVFAPDLMNFLVGESDSIDLEIVDNEVYVYFGAYLLADQAFWRRVMRLRDSLGDKLVERAGSRYKDDRTTSGFVSLQGARLKQGISVFAVIIMIMYAINIALELWSGMQR